jgi:hypothetical protein
MVVDSLQVEVRNSEYWMKDKCDAGLLAIFSDANAVVGESLEKVERLRRAVGVSQLQQLPWPVVKEQTFGGLDNCGALALLKGCMRTPKQASAGVGQFRYPVGGAKPGSPIRRTDKQIARVRVPVKVARVMQVLHGTSELRPHFESLTECRLG